MLVDSHCHLTFPELHGRLDQVFASMEANSVEIALCVAVDFDDFERARAIAERFPQVYASVGVHPDHAPEINVTEEHILSSASHPRVIAIGETGLDYYRLTGDLEWQRERFRTHIRAAHRCGKPLIVHTRAAASDTLRLMREEGAADAGGVMHCFTETWEVASAALDLGFCISFSGIVTFKNAAQLREVAKKVPLDRLLIETDAPYLAPVPHRGKTNEPAFVRHVAEHIAEIRGLPVERIAEATTENFLRLFKLEPP